MGSMNPPPGIPPAVARPGQTRANLAHLGLWAFIFVFSLLLYTFTHESGHALVGVLFGAKITSFSIDFIGMSAHVGHDANFTPLQQSAVSLAGVMLPYLLVIALLAAAPRRANALMEWVKLLTGIVTISSLLAWVVLPWLYLAGQRPGDDSITFISSSGVHPALVSAGALLLFGAGLALLFRQVEGPPGILLRIRAGPAALTSPASRRTLVVLAAVLAAAAAISVGLGVAFGTSPADFLAIPPGYTRAAEIQLNQHARAGEAAYTFTLENPARVSLFFAVSGLPHGPAEITLQGPGGYRSTFFTAGPEASGSFTVHPRDLPLAAGRYQVLLTFPQGPGVLTIGQQISAP
jgi:hypothetical protein